MDIQAQKYAEGRALRQPEPEPIVEVATPKRPAKGRAKAVTPAVVAEAPADVPSLPAAPGGVRALVLSPTNELAAQSARVLKVLLPGTAVRATLLTNSTAVGTDFSKVRCKLLTNPLTWSNCKLCAWVLLCTSTAFGGSIT